MNPTTHHHLYSNLPPNGLPFSSPDHHRHHHHHQSSVYHQIHRQHQHQHGEQHQQAAAQSSSEAAHARAYRSRKDRPCDSCRKRKSRCIIEEAGQDCQSCRMNGRSCTFEISPTPRSRPIKNEDGVTISSVIMPRKRSHSQYHTDSSSPPNPGSSTYSADDSHTPQKVCLPMDRTPSSSQDQDRRHSIASHRARRPAAVSSSTKRQAGIAGLAADDRDRREEKATSNQLYGLISALMHGRDHDPDARSDSSSEQGADDPSERLQQEEKGMMPVVLGSSSSEDPQLLRQAGSSPTRQGYLSPVNDHMSNSSKTTMPPPPTPETQATQTGAPVGLGPLQVRQVTSDPHHPIFFAFVPAHPYGRSKGKDREIGSQGFAKLKSNLQGRIGPLMVLYSQRDSAAFPLLMESQRRRFRLAALEASKQETYSDVPLPAVLATATLATATVYDVSLRPISKEAWGANLHALMEQFEISTLVTLQVALTDLTGRPSINTSGNFMTFNQTLAISHMLGLHLDPTSWNLPREEKDVRIRLWWATVIHDKWSSLCWGRPSTIHHQDYTVPLPRRNSLSPCQEHLEDRDLHSFDFAPEWTRYSDAHTPGDTFVGLCRLSLILSEILDEFHSVRAVHLIHRDAFNVAQRIKSYFVALEDWKDLLPHTLRSILKGDEEDVRGPEGVPGTRSLQLSYLGVNLLLCRTALDAVTTKGTQDANRLVPAHKTALHVALMVVEFLESLTAEDYGGFFLHYGSHHLASCLSLLARLCFGFARMQDDEMLSMCINTLQRLLIVLSEAHRLYKWDLAELALTRSRAILPALETRIPDFPKFSPAFESASQAQTPSHQIVSNSEGGDGNGEVDDPSMMLAHNGQRTQGQAPPKGLLATAGNAGGTKAHQTFDQPAGLELQTGALKDPSMLNGLRAATSFGQGATAGMRDPMHAPQHDQQQHSMQHGSHTVQNSIIGDQTSTMFHFPTSNNGAGASIPIDAVGLPYPLGFNNMDVRGIANGAPAALGSGTSGASHLLSNMELDWLGMGLQPNTYPDYFLANHNNP